MANMVAEHMEWYHTKFIRGATPISLEKPDPEGQIKVTWKSDDDPSADEEEDGSGLSAVVALSDGLLLLLDTAAAEVVPMPGYGTRL